MEDMQAINRCWAMFLLIFQRPQVISRLIGKAKNIAAQESIHGKKLPVWNCGS